MAEQNQNGDWRTQGFRAKVINQIEEAVRQSATNMTKSSVEMENHVYDKAKSREEYLALVARLILHVRDIRNAQEKRAQPQGMPPQVGMPQGMQQKPMQDPINALQNLAMQGMGHQNTPNMSASAQTQLMHQRRQLMDQQQMLQQQQQQQQQQQRMTTTHNRPALQRQDAFIVTSAQQVQPVTQPLPASATGGSNMGFQQPGPALGSVPRQALGQGMMGGQQAFSQGMTQQSAGVQQPTPSPVQNIGSQSTSSPMTAMTSPSPQSTVVPSPASRAAMGVPSPNSSLNTPGNPTSMGMAASPVARSTEEQAYLDKLKKLSKYIQPLRRMINRLDKDEDHEKHKQDISKMKNLLGILTNPSKRLKMETLEKCEQALVKLELQQKSQTAGISSTTHMCQPLLDAVAAHIKSPMLNHTLQRTFGPAITALCGSPIRAPSPPPKRLKTDGVNLNHELSDLLQGEIARLNSQFCVKLDPLHHTGSKVIHLHCKLDDRNLPTVPPILVTVPENYPGGSPECYNVSKDYDSTPFLKCIQAALSTQLLKMPSKFSLTALLDTWEMSVRKACAMSL